MDIKENIDILVPSTYGHEVKMDIYALVIYGQKGGIGMLVSATHGHEVKVDISVLATRGYG